jgi:4-amino-4-deoxy-L-arabinose transferase
LGIKAAIWLILLLLVLGFAFQGSRALWETDEGRYTENAMQMIASGDYLVPAYNNSRANFAKPPVTYWIIAASLQLFGHSTWAVRTPYALAFVLTALLLWGMGRRLLPERPWLPALVYGLSLGPFIAANWVTTDVLLTFCEALAVYGFVAADYAANPSQRRLDLYIMWLGFGLAFLTKGPPGLVPLLAIIPFTAIRGGWRDLRRFFPPLGLALFLIIGFGWYGVVVIRRPGLLHYFLYYEVYARLFTGAQHRHAQWYGWAEVYIPVFVLGTLPWWLPLLRGLRQAASFVRWRRWLREAPPALFLLLWFVVPLAAFCAARSRLPLYVLPLFMPLSLLIALELRRGLDFGKGRQQAFLCAWIAVLIGLKAGFSYFAHSRADDRVAARGLRQAAHGQPFASLVFVHMDAPWGVRFYLRRPVYEIKSPQSHLDKTICQTIDAHPRALFVVQNADSQAFRTAARRCPQQVTHIGEWRNATLLSAQKIDSLGRMR